MAGIEIGNMNDRDNRYLEIILSPIRVCMNYKPKLGHGSKNGFSLNRFLELYRGDPFYNWFGLDNPLMYAAHKAAGGITSIYRQIGIGCENLFRTILQDQFQLSDEDSKWSYNITVVGGKTRLLSLDGRIPLDKIRDEEKRKRVNEWIREAAYTLDVDQSIVNNLQGVVFEVRQGYKSKDSKRQNADIANAAKAYIKSYLPSVVVLSTQIDEDIAIRYRNEKWFLLVGSVGNNKPLYSTYDFMETVVGYDLSGFFMRHKAIFSKEIDVVLKTLLSAE